MGDIYVHVRMKECCRNTLTELDKHKKKAKHPRGVLAVKSLFEVFSEKTIDDAKAAIPGGRGPLGGELEALTRSMCEKVCSKHAEEHEGKGETEEGGFWRDLVAAIQGKPLNTPTLATTPGAHGKHKGRGYVAYVDGTKVGWSRAWRNNNPGNIVAGMSFGSSTTTPSSCRSGCQSVTPPPHLAFSP